MKQSGNVFCENRDIALHDVTITTHNLFSSLHNCVWFVHGRTRPRTKAQQGNLWSFHSEQLKVSLKKGQLTLEMSVFQFLFGGQFTISTQLINPFLSFIGAL